MKRALIPTLLEERAALEDNAGGRARPGGSLPALRLGPGLPGAAGDRSRRCGQPGRAGGDREAALPLPLRAAALFPPQHRDWALPAEAALTPRAAERVARESAVQSVRQRRPRAVHRLGPGGAGRQAGAAVGRGAGPRSVVRARDARGAGVRAGAETGVPGERAAAAGDRDGRRPLPGPRGEPRHRAAAGARTRC